MEVEVEVERPQTRNRDVYDILMISCTKERRHDELHEDDLAGR